MSRKRSATCKYLAIFTYPQLRILRLTLRNLQTTSSASNHTVLGKLDGPAQTLLAAGCAVGPFLSGGLFSIATHIRPKGEALVFGVFGGIAFLGFLMSLGIRDGGLEAEGWDEEGSEDDEDHGEVEESS